MLPDLLGLERHVIIVMTGERGGGQVEGSGVMLMCTRLVPAAVRTGAQSDCSTSSPVAGPGGGQGGPVPPQMILIITVLVFCSDNTSRQL